MTWNKIKDFSELKAGMKIRFDDRFGKFTYWIIAKIEGDKITITNEEGDNFLVPSTLLKGVETES